MDDDRPLHLVVAGNNCYATLNHAKITLQAALDVLMLRQFLDPWPYSATLLTSNTAVERARSEPSPYQSLQISGRRASQGLGRMAMLPNTVRLLAGAVRRSDVAYARLPSPNGYWLLRVARAAGVPAFVSLHGAPASTLDRSLGRQTWLSGTSYRSLRSLVRGAVWSFSTSAQLLDTYGADTSAATVYKSSIITDVTAGNKPSKRASGGQTLLFAGRLSPEKNPKLFLEVLERLSYLLPGTKGLVLGSGPQEHELKVMARSRNLSVEFLGWLDHPDRVREAIASADLVLVPSRREGSPKILVEAMAAGTPAMIAARNSTIDEYVEAGAVISVPSLAPQDWVDTALSLLSGDRYDATVRAGRFVAKQLTLVALNAQISQVYAEQLIPRLRLRVPQVPRAAE